MELQLVLLQGGDRLHGSPGTSQGGHRGHGVIEGSPAQVLVVVGSLATDGGVDDQLDQPRTDRVFDIGAPLMHLEDRLHG